MKTKLVLLTILSGIILGLITIYVVPAKYELWLWAIVAIAGGAVVRRNYSRKLFRNGFLLAVLLGVFITLTHLVLLDDYRASHREEMQQMQEFGISDSIRLTLLAVATQYWFILGLLTGVFSVIWTRVK